MDFLIFLKPLITNKGNSFWFNQLGYNAISAKQGFESMYILSNSLLVILNKFKQEIFGKFLNIINLLKAIVNI